MTIIVTGGAGFIGSNFIFHMLKKYPDLSGWEPFGPVRSSSDERYGPAGGDSCTKDPETGAYPDYRRL